MKKLMFLLILPIFLGLIFSGCYYPTRVVYVPPEERFAPPPAPSAVSLEPIYFDFNKSNITSDAKAILDKNAEWISKNPTAKIQIVGHCDERASNEYNMDLGKRRANAAKQYLVNLGIAADRLSTVSRGKEKPLDPGHNENSWAENRRVDFNVAGEILGKQIKPRGEMDYGYPLVSNEQIPRWEEYYYPPYPYYYPWGYYDPWWGGYPYWGGGLGFGYYYYPHAYYYGGYYGGHHGGGYRR
jgi:peptidoglycan-associated lipoprotein